VHSFAHRSHKPDVKGTEPVANSESGSWNYHARAPAETLFGGSKDADVKQDRRKDSPSGSARPQRPAVLQRDGDVAVLTHSASVFIDSAVFQ
jgi:hypothetical protein